MQNEEGTSSAESLESLQYANQHQSNSVLDPRVIAEQSEAFDSTAMGGHGQEIKRSADVLSEDSDDSSPSLDLSKRKKTKGRVKIEMKFINNKLRRYTTFSKRKTGIMKKAYELSTLTGTQVMLLVASETGHVYTFATRKLQPMITSEAGKALIQTCLNSPDPPVSAIPNPDQRMSATGYEETDLSYSVNENEEKDQRMFTTQQIENSQVLVTSGTSTNAAMTGMTAMPSSGHSFPITTYIPPSTLQQGIKGSPSPSSYSVQQMPGGGFTTIFTPGNNLGSTHVQLGQSSVPQGQQQVQVMNHYDNMSLLQPCLN